MDFGFVKVGAYTPKIKVADVENNVCAIKEGIVKANENNLELVVFPELCITGYTCGDLFYSKVLLDNAINGLKDIVDFSKNYNMLIFVGLPYKHEGLIYNVAVAINKGEVLGVIPKTFLPNYNEFYEKRVFTGAKEGIKYIDILGEKVAFSTNIIFREKTNKLFTVGCELCEDLWSITPPSVNHAINGANIIVNLSCSDEIIGKAEYRKNLVSMQSSKLTCGYIYCDAGEGESTTDLVFAGHNVIAENGSVLSESNLFSTGLICADIDTEFLDFERSKLYNQDYKKGDYVYVEFSANNNGKLERTFSKTPFVPTSEDERKNRADLILTMQAEGLKKRIIHTHAENVVLGLSGGLDSTLAVLVAVNAVKMAGKSPKNVIAITMPCFGTTSRTYLNSISLAKSLGTTLKKIDIGKSVKRHLKDIKHSENVFDSAYENSQARERTQVLMDTANMYNGLVVGTGDLSEMALGWATYNGDHMSMYGVNCSIPKTLVRHIISYYIQNSKGKLKAVLTDILNTPVSPELLPAENGEISQKTEDLVGPYILNDFFLYYFLRKGYSPKKIYSIAVKTFEGDFSKETILKWLKTFVRRFFNQQFKRSCMPDGVKVGSVALSPRGDLRMPSDAVATLWQKELEEI